MALSSDELNYLIYRYLQESGFSHSAFAFACESLVAKASVSGGDIPPGALISFVQKGLQHLEIEASVQGGASADPSGAPALSLLHWHASKVAENAEDNSTFDEFSVPEPMVATLAGHTGDVYLGAWNPKRNEILSGSEDGTTRLWKLSDDACSAEIGARCVSSEQNHDGGAGKTSVTSVTWNAEGTAFATGSFDGFVRFWTAGGQLSKALQIHKGPVFALRFNASGSLLLSCGQDKCAIVTEVASGSQKQKIEFHSGAVIDCDWRCAHQKCCIYAIVDIPFGRSNDTFATCSVDKAIHVCQIGRDSPLRTFKGHSGDVNTIRWDPSGAISLLHDLIQCCASTKSINRNTACLLL